MNDASYLTFISIGCFVVLGIMVSAMFVDFMHLRQDKHRKEIERRRNEAEERLRAETDQKKQS